MPFAFVVETSQDMSSGLWLDRTSIEGVMHEFDRVWERIEGNAGQEFRQKRGKSFIYAVNDGCVVPSTTNPILPRSDFAKAFERQPLGSPIRHRSSAAARGRPRSVRTWQAGLNTVTAPAVPASSGGCDCTWWRRCTGCRWVGR